MIIFAVLGVFLLLAVNRERIADYLAPPVLAVSLPQLEREFDKNGTEAAARYGQRPVEFTGKVASVDGNDLRLETVFILSVHAEMVEPPAVEQGATVRLWCRRVYAETYPVGAKPRFERCYLIAR